MWASTDLLFILFLFFSCVAPLAAKASSGEAGQQLNSLQQHPLLERLVLQVGAQGIDQKDQEGQIFTCTGWLLPVTQAPGHCQNALCAKHFRSAWLEQRSRLRDTRPHCDLHFQAGCNVV
jgi:hypothetical protein